MIPLFVAISTCLGVEGERITAGDLARAHPVFGTLAAGEPVAFAPAPGAKRTFTPGELARLAARHHLDTGPLETVCFANALVSLDEGRLKEALQKALPDSRVRVEIVDFSRFPAPEGEVQFAGLSWASLAPDRGDGTRLVRGKVAYRGRLGYPIWVRARFTIEGRRLVAASLIRAGEPIKVDQVRVEEFTGPIRGAPATVPDFAGLASRRSLAAGELVDVSRLELPREIRRGDKVQVEAQEGSARLKLDARAESGGRRGENVVLFNTLSGKRFVARVAGPGLAVVGGRKE